MLFFIVRDEFQIREEGFVEAGGKKVNCRKSRESLFIESVLKMFKLYW